jgi:hypothetical protein
MISFKRKILLTLLSMGLVVANSANAGVKPIPVPTVPEVIFKYAKVCGATPTSTKNIACKIGTVGPGGGWIFFVDYYNQYSGFTYLEAAPTNISAVVWCNVSTLIPGLDEWSANAVGVGQANTTAMIGACTSGAANSADLYLTATKSDWFLGSEGEVMLMYTNLRQAGVGGFVVNDGYWSSTEGSDTHAWGMFFSSGVQNYPTKDTTQVARAVRSF